MFRTQQKSLSIYDNPGISQKLLRGNIANPDMI